MVASLARNQGLCHEVGGVWRGDVRQAESMAHLVHPGDARHQGSSLPLSKAT
jgi:hypothetical protein